jgi:hypothetical protein
VEVVLLRQRSSLFLLVFVLVLLILGFVFRYQQIAYTPIKQHYLDRWTGIEWVKTYSWNGLVRVPANLQVAGQLTTAEKRDRLEQIRRQDRLLTISWYAAVFAVSTAIVNQLSKKKS